jgi:hypothetical protein
LVEGVRHFNKSSKITGVAQAQLPLAILVLG